MFGHSGFWEVSSNAMFGRSENSEVPSIEMIARYRFSEVPSITMFGRSDFQRCLPSYGWVVPNIRISFPKDLGLSALTALPHDR